VLHTLSNIGGVWSPQRGFARRTVDLHTPCWRLLTNRGVVTLMFAATLAMRCRSNGTKVRLGLAMHTLPFYSTALWPKAEADLHVESRDVP